MKILWRRLFLIERPSLSMGLFRIAAALTVGVVVLPTFFHLEDTFYAVALKTYNPNFFPVFFIKLVETSPDGLVTCFVVLFCLSWFFFLIGLFSQVSCICMTACYYYFYALNTFAVATLSWDILLVTLFLMCVMPYHGDYFSLDCLRLSRLNKGQAYKRLRPFFLQRLLQLQIAFTFFYTACYKITAQGNWITDNPIYYLMNYPQLGVVKNFILKDVLWDKPELCYGIGLAVVIVEFLMIFLLFWRKTRIAAISLGIFFYVILILTLDAPATFFFLFMPQLLLFINPENIVEWIEVKRRFNRSAKRAQLIYDGQCRFCQRSIQWLEVMDLFGVLRLVSSEGLDEKRLKSVHPDLTVRSVQSALQLVDCNGKLYAGFDVFRRICFVIPMFYPMILFFHCPGMRTVGGMGYKMFARYRHCFRTS